MCRTFALRTPERACEQHGYTWEKARFSGRFGSLRTKTTDDRFAVGTPDDFDVIEDDARELDNERYYLSGQYRRASTGSSAPAGTGTRIRVSTIAPRSSRVSETPGSTGIPRGSTPIIRSRSRGVSTRSRTPRGRRDSRKRACPGTTCRSSTPTTSSKASSCSS